MVDIGYIIIPSGVDRDKYVQTCLNTCKVSIAMDKGGSIFTQCFIPPTIIQDIVFPKDEYSTGSVVVLAKTPFSETPIILQSLKPLNELLNYSENTYNRSVSSDGGSVNVTMGKDGDLYISVDSAKSGKVYMSVLGDSKTILDIKSSGSVNVSASENISVEAFKNLKIKCRDVNNAEESFVELGPKGVNLNVVDKVVVNKGDSPVAMSDEVIKKFNEVKNQIDQIVLAIQSAPTVTGDGGSSFKTSLVSQLQGINKIDFGTIKSTNLFAD